MTAISRIAAAVLLIIITFATLSPIGLRPHVGEANFERGTAYFLPGLTLAMGFPNRILYGAAFIVGVAAILEAMQMIDPSRHGRVSDMLMKAVAGVVGVLVAKGLMFAVRRRAAE
jgi:hypothetical protein